MADFEKEIFNRERKIMSDKNISQLTSSHCVGCRSCEQSCPKSCISMREDKEGFIFPYVNENCINCGLCLKHCPILTPYQNKPFSTERYAIILKDKAIFFNVDVFKF